LKSELIAMFDRRYDAIIRQGTLFHESLPPLQGAASGKKRGRTKRRTGHNLLLRLTGRKEETLRFLYDDTVPFTNNAAERDLRMMKTRNKISGGFRTMEGAEEFAIIRSLLVTARKQGWGIMETLTANPQELAMRLRTE
jgi:transposase